MKVESLSRMVIIQSQTDDWFFRLLSTLVSYSPHLPKGNGRVKTPLFQTSVSDWGLRFSATFWIRTRYTSNCICTLTSQTRNKPSLSLCFYSYLSNELFGDKTCLISIAGSGGLFKVQESKWTTEKGRGEGGWEEWGRGKTVSKFFPIMRRS